MAAWNDAKFTRRYRVFYACLVVCAICYFTYAYFDSGASAKKHKNEVYNWEIKGIVSNMRTPGHDAVYVTVNNKEYDLYDYRTWLDINNDKWYDSVSRYSANTRIRNGDSLIKNARQWNLTLVEFSTHKRFKFNCKLNE